MTLSTGTKLSHYEITSQIGKGGMGEVYQATDTKLGRSVAIKVLPEEFARDAERVARFQREAKLLASLNHPNIAAIHGLEEADNIHFLVLELVEGQDLAERIKSGSVDVEEALKLGLQIAEALEAAHERGVIHRDLKPANIKVTPDNKVKVLDFGLAKAYAGEQDQATLSNSPTLSDMATQQGLILGTAAYMSPEQARGKPVDKRTDVWAFGCVLYEMLTGQAAFQGEDVTEILAAVVKSGVNMDLLPANLHPRISEVLGRCLQKDQKKRYGGIGDAQYEIERVLGDPSGMFVQPVAAVKAKKKVRLGIPWVAAIAVLCLIIAGLTVWYIKPLEPRRVMEFDYHLPEDQEFIWRTVGVADLAVSPEGSHFVYLTPEGLYLRFLDQLDVRLIPGTNEYSIMPFFSPDGNWLGYTDNKEGKLKKVAINGGTPMPICDAQSALYPSWNKDNSIIYGTVDQGIMQVSADGGVPETLIEAEDGLLLAPQIMPDGKSILYFRRQNTVYTILIHSLESGETKELFKGVAPRYLPTGHLVYVLDNILYAVPFDPEEGEMTGDKVPIVDGVQLYSISNEGTLVFIPGKSGVRMLNKTLVWVDREGNEVPLTVTPDRYNSPSISPDGTRVAVYIDLGGNDDIYILDLARKNKNLKQLSFDESSDVSPIWTPDSEQIIFASNREGTYSIYRKAADGTGTAELLASKSDENIRPDSISRDGKTLFIEHIGGGNGYNVGMLAMEGDDQTIKMLLNEVYDEEYPKISPDGRWLAYQSDKYNQPDIFVCPFPDGVKGGMHRISTDGGQHPFWSSDGRELFYRGPEGVISVPVIEAGSTFDWDTPKLLFPSQYEFWGIHPDNKRFLMLKPFIMEEGASTGEGPRKINIFINFDEKLKKRVTSD